MHFRFPPFVLFAASAMLAVLVSPLQAKDAPAKEGAVLVMVTDDKQPIYDRFVASFEVQSRADFYEYSLYGEEANASQVVNQALAVKPNLFVAVGPKSARALAGRTGKTPLLVTMVPAVHKQKASLGDNLAGVMLERSPVSRFQVLKQLFPKASRLGIAYDPKVSQARLSAAKRAAKSMGLSIVPAPISNPAEVTKSLRTLSKEVDVLVLLSDPSLLNLTAIDAIVGFSVVHKIPAVALSHQMVARGILMGLSVDYSKLGDQAGRIANQIVFEGVAPGALGFVPPEGLQISLNLTASEKFPYTCDIKSRVLVYAADNDFDVEIYR